MKKLLLFALVMIGLPACDGCGPFEKMYVDVTGLAAVVALRQPTNAAAQVLVAGQSTPAAELQLRLQLNSRVYSALLAPAGGFAAMACEPADPEYTEIVDSLTVTSRYPFDARHPAGTSLNDLLRIDNGYGTSVSLAQQLATPQGVGELGRHAIRLSQAPTSSATQQFRVRYHQTNGELYTAETVEFIIAP